MADEFVAELPVDLSDVWQRVVSGADWQTTLEMLDANEDPENTTGWTMEVKVYDLENNLLKTLTIGSGIVHTAAQGRFDITYAAADTGLLAVQRVRITVKTVDAAAGVDFPFVAVLDVFYPTGP